MDFNQTKLTKTEWQSIEQPLPENEIYVLELIKQGMANVNICHNHQKSLFQHLKISYSPEMEDHLFNVYFSPIYTNLKKSHPELNIKPISKPVIKNADKIRLEQNQTKIINNHVYEFVLLKHVEAILNSAFGENTFEFYYYTLYHLSKNNVYQLNKYVVELVVYTLEYYKEQANVISLLEQSVNIIEKNSSLLKYKNITLYEHQKQLFTEVTKEGPKLILYTAPTGTGKTLSPIGLSERYKVIFVCAARHVGLSLARSAISVQKKIAFAFGCNTMEDIRLHYYAAADYTINKRSGGIGRVDNSNGIKVELLICDIKSYLLSMTYMLQFNMPQDIIMYWDEPTISMDYDDHELHPIINEAWSKNRIPNIVLSSATLPKFYHLTSVIEDFKRKTFTQNDIENDFTEEQNGEKEEIPKPTICNIVSYECVKTIPIYDNNGYIFVPHYFSPNYREVIDVAEHCQENSTLLRYLDLGEVVIFIRKVIQVSGIETVIEYLNIRDISQLSMETIKRGYLSILQNLDPDIWDTIYTELLRTRRCYALKPSTGTSNISGGGSIKKFYSVGPENTSGISGGEELRRVKSVQEPGNQVVPPPEFKPGTYGIYITTSDAHTLTEGPTIFLANDVEKIAQFCLQQSNIPAIIMDDLVKKIERNNILSDKLGVLEKELEDITEATQSSSSKSKSSKSSGKSKDKDRSREQGEGKEERAVSKKLQSEIDNLRLQVKSVNLNEVFIPNSSLHLTKWAPSTKIGTAFTSYIDEATIVEIMSLHGINDSWKILLLMGIGIFTTHKNPRYLEIVKQLAVEQRLYLIIASSDYIYGTNYQFCHGYLSKDLDLTQEKIIQSIGRIGRNNIQQSYSIRFRDNKFIEKLFTSQGLTPEIVNMNRLFTTNIYEDLDPVED